MTKRIVSQSKQHQDTKISFHCGTSGIGVPPKGNRTGSNKLRVLLPSHLTPDRNPCWAQIAALLSLPTQQTKSTWKIPQSLWKCLRWKALDIFSFVSSFTAVPDSPLCRTNPRFSHPQPLPITPTLTCRAARFNPPLKRFQARFELPRKSPHSSISITLGYRFCWLNYLNRNT